MRKSPRTPLLLKGETNFLPWVIGAGHEDIGGGLLEDAASTGPLAPRSLGQEEADPSPCERDEEGHEAVTFLAPLVSFGATDANPATTHQRHSNN
jgi:hypothetical protein